MFNVSAPKFSSARSKLLTLVRQGAPVTWTPPWMGFGNVLYLWLNAWIEQSDGGNRRVLDTPAMEPWLATFPHLREAGLTVSARDVPFTARRDMPWKSNLGSEAYTSAQLEQFVREFILSSSLFKSSDSLDVGLTTDRCLVVNVRRGDYYSNPEFERQFGFDQLSYLKEAIPAAVARGAITERIHVVSDGVDWCRHHLGWLREYSNVVTYSSPEDSPQQNLLTVASARRLVMTNSTFSYWCGYISNVIHGDNHASIWAPRFFARFEEGGRSKQLDERWSIIEDIDGGWNREYTK